MRLLCAVAPVLLALIVLNLVLQASGSWAAPPRRCLTYEEKSLGRLQTICSDGTRAVSTWSPAWQQWTTTVTLPPGQTCTGRLNPRTQQMERRCR